MSWYCDRCRRVQKDNILGGLVYSGDYKFNSKTSYSMKEHSISRYENICYKCHNYLFGSSFVDRLFEDKKYDQGNDTDGLSSRFMDECFEFDKEYNLISPRTKLYWDEDYDKVIEYASGDYLDTEYLYNDDYAIENEECARCGRKIKKGEIVYTNRLRYYLESHNVYEDICVCCDNYIYLENLNKNYRNTIDSDYQNDNETGLSSRFNPKCKDFDTEHNFVNPRNMEFYDEDGFEDISFSDNADVILQKGLFSKSTCALYKSLIESVNNSYQTRFASDFQTYVTRLGLIINKTVENKNFYGKNHYQELLKYICKDILDNDYLYKNLLKINSHANDVKHSTKDITVDIKDYLIYYNSMIDKLKEISGCKAFEKCHIYYKKSNLNNQTQKKSQKEIICHCCRLVNPREYYRCPKCKKLTCNKCYNREKRLCEDCENE